MRFHTLHHIHKMFQNCWRKSFLNTQNPGASGGLRRRGPLPGLWPGPAGDLKRSPDLSPTFVPPNTKSWIRAWWYCSSKKSQMTWNYMQYHCVYQILSIKNLHPMTNMYKPRRHINDKLVTYNILWKNLIESMIVYWNLYIRIIKGCRGRDSMVVGFMQ